jgi:predicted metal-dependent phosphoesterase TrpH
MSDVRKWCLFLAAALIAACPSLLGAPGAAAQSTKAAGRKPAAASAYHWYKGNTHAHTTKSDGNETPRRVARWYLDHEYNFLVLSDHNTLTPTRYIDTDDRDDFILIPGEEVTDRAEGKPVHMTALGIGAVVEPRHGKTIVETLQNNVKAVHEAGGIAIVNHPNWRYSFGANELEAVPEAKLFEVYNVTKDCNDFPAGGAPGTENIWDAVLASHVLMYGVVSDDTHDYLGEFSAGLANPGRGWIMVRASELTPKAILSAIEKGNFYGTNGVVLRSVDVTDKDYSIEIEPSDDARFTTYFIGKGGAVLKEDYNLKAAYQFTGDEGYVRAKIVCSSGDYAITQPVLVPSGAH